MSIKFISHEEFPEDLYTRELVYLELHGTHRVAYVRKQAKNGGMFWSVLTLGVMKDGMKVYYEGYLQDSTFLEKDIKTFLDQRPWEKVEHVIQESPKSSIHDEEVPF